ncbi:MAG: hypothetical protein K2H20_02920, partial [Bacilli bacterium]|nr:hypothetical protein [Bacilli bacterium]
INMVSKMRITTIIILSLIFIIIVAIVGVIIYVKNKLSKLSNEVFGTPNIIEGFKRQELELSETPKSVSSLDSVLIPKIKKDFPDLNINEIKSLAENSLIKYFSSLEKGKVQKIENINDKLISRIEQDIENINKSEEKISGLKIHRTVINSYKNNSGACIITFQSSLEYIKETKKEKKKVQSRYNTNVIYVYDETKVKGAYGVSLNCKNCGAPIKELGVKSCPYCETGIVVTISKIWKIDDIFEG